MSIINELTREEILMVEMLTYLDEDVAGAAEVDFYKISEANNSHMFQEARTRNCEAITNALSFNHEPIVESQDTAESEKTVDIDEGDDEAEEESMSLSM